MVASEKYVTGAIECADGRQVRLHGTIDRIDQHPEHGLRIIDYKTGDRGVSAWQAHVRKIDGQPAWVDLQLPTYRELLASHSDDDGLTRDLDSIECGYITLPKQDAKPGAAWTPLAPSRNSTKEPSETAGQALRRVLSGIIDRQFWPPAAPPKYADGLDALLGDGLPADERARRIAIATTKASTETSAGTSA